MASDVINFAHKLARFSEHWSPRVVAEMNDYQFKLVKLQGEFVWHDHRDTDEVRHGLYRYRIAGLRERDEWEAGCCWPLQLRARRLIGKETVGVSSRMSRLDDLQVRTMRRDELPFAIDLAAREGWNPGLYDAESFFAADPGAFLIGELQGEPVGCVSAVSYAGRYGFVGLYIVRPEFRGQGYGMRLWEAAMVRLRGLNVGLDGVVAQQANYARSGFRLAYRNVRYRGRAEPAAIHASVAPAAEVTFKAIGDFDRQIFPERRDAFLRAWLRQPMAGAYVAQDGGRLSGFTVVRRCREGWKIGPLAADDAVTARYLYEAAAAHAPYGDAVFMDIPEANPAAKSFLATLSLTPVFETARMYTGPDPEVELPKLFGVTTLELG